MKRIGIFLATIMFLFAMAIPGFSAAGLTTGDQTIYGNKTFEHGVTVKGNLTAEGPLLGGKQYSTEYYVCSTNGHDSPGNYGKTYLQPFATVDFAIGQCTANKDDIIYVLPGHAESFSAADGFDVDVAGVTIIGLGNGVDMPEFTFADTDATVAIGAANVTLMNLRFIAGIDAVVIGIAVEDAGDNATIRNCVFPEPSDSDFDFIDAIDLEDDANGVKILYDEYYHTAATGPAHFVEMGNGANDDFQFIGNIVQGEFSVAAIWSDDADLRCVIKDNIVMQMTSGECAIEFTGNATGFIDGNRVYTDAEATSIDPGIMNIGVNYVSTAVNVSGVVYPVPDTGWTQLNQSTLDLIQAEAEDAIEADVLDKLMAAADGTGDDPASVADNSVLAYIMVKASGDADATEFDNQTDSLEAIRDRIDTLNLADQIDLDAILATTPSPLAYTATVSSSAGTTSSVYDSLTGFGTDYFKNGWTMIVLWDADGAGGAPETEVVDITAYATATGTFTHGATTQLAAGDKVLFVRDELVSIYQKALPAVPVTDSLAYKISKWVADGDGDFATGTTLASNKSLVDAIGTNGTTVADTTTGIAGMIGVNDADNAMDTTTVVPNEDGSVFERLEALESAANPSYNHPNYLAVTADLTDSTWNTTTAHEIAVVTGTVRMQIVVEVTNTCVTTSNDGTIALGVAGNTDAIFAAVDLDSGAADFTAGDVVSGVYGAVPTTPVGVANATNTITGGLFDVVVVGGVDVGYTLATHAATNGTLVFHIWWTPLSSTGAVTAGAGGAFS